LDLLGLKFPQYCQKNIVIDSQARPTWDEYFMMIAKLSAVRSTCLAFPVGAVIVKDRQILATGYNGSPPGSPHCTAQGYCYEGLQKCTDNNLPSRSIHAEANAIAQAAKHGIRTEGSTIYVTLEPCLSCLKLIISSGIKQVFYETVFNTGDRVTVRDSFVNDGLVKLTPIQLSVAATIQAAQFLQNPTSITREI
jgi:dCMP deaminase